ncbi:MAG: LCP family protein [Clostridiaceae bacterium]|nr:LCP family protein [Clostridiaceae bacterium]
MNIRRFYMALTSILLVFLFFSGIVMLNYLKAYSAQDAIADDEPGGFLEDAMKHFVMAKDPINVVLLVGDKWESNTDTIMVVNYDPKTNNLNILSIPRDTRVTLSNGRMVKVNSVFANKGGDILLMKLLGDMLGIDIQYYVYLNLEVFRTVIDLLDGVWIDIPIDLDYDDPLQNLHIHLKKGRQILDGEKAEQYLRFRHPNGPYTEEMLKYYDGSDLKRIEAQQKFIQELIKQKVKITYISKLNSIIDAVFDHLKTNVPLSEVLKLASNFNIKDFSIDKVKTFTLPGYAMDTVPWHYIYDNVKTGELIKENFSLKKQ